MADRSAEIRRCESFVRRRKRISDLLLLLPKRARKHFLSSRLSSPSSPAAAWLWRLQFHHVSVISMAMAYHRWLPTVMSLWPCLNDGAQSRCLYVHFCGDKADRRWRPAHPTVVLVRAGAPGGSTERGGICSRAFLLLLLLLLLLFLPAKRSAVVATATNARRSRLSGTF